MAPVGVDAVLSGCSAAGGSVVPGLPEPALLSVAMPAACLMQALVGDSGCSLHRSL